MKCYAIENHAHDCRVTMDDRGVVQTLSSRMGTGGNNTPFVLIPKEENAFVANSSGDGVAAPLDASYYKGQGLRQGIEREYVMMKAHVTGNGQLANSVIDDAVVGTLDCMHDQKMVILEGDDMEQENNRKYVLRRLTPTECARLQGFPDWWCDGADGSDSAQYKLWGNGVALPCVAFIMGNIAKDMKKGEKQDEQECASEPESEMV